MAEERGDSRALALGGVRYALVTVPPEATKEEYVRYRDTFQRVGVEDEFERKLGQLSSHLDAISGTLTRPFTTYSAMTVPPTSIVQAYKTYMTALLLEAQQVLREMVSEVEKLYESVARAPSPERLEELARSIESFALRNRSLITTVIVASQKLTNLLARSLPPQLRSALVNESLGRMMVPVGE